MKKTFIHGIIAGILAAIAGIVYFNMYQSAFGTSFDEIINIPSIAGASIFGCMLMALGYFILIKLKKEKLSGIMNLLIVLLSFLSIISPMAMSLPLSIEAPELFPGLVVPMHFFPALMYLGIAPFFNTGNA